MSRGGCGTGCGSSEWTKIQRLKALVRSLGGIVVVPTISSTDSNGIIRDRAGWTRHTQPTIGSWTAGTGWTGLTHAATGAGDLSQACLIIGCRYLIAWSLSISAGTITAKAGTTADTARSTSGVYYTELTCTVNTSLIFSASADAVATISIIGVVCLSNSSVSFDVGGGSFVQATETNMPWHSSVNGLNALSFGGVSDNLKLVSSMTVQHLFMVMQNNTSTWASNYPGVFTSSDQSVLNTWFFLGKTLGSSEWFACSGVSHYQDGSTSASDTITGLSSPHVYEAVCASPMTIPGLSLGQDRDVASRFFAGNIRGIVTLPASLSVTSATRLRLVRLMGALGGVSL